jgi:hypothetical protein
VKKVDAFSPCHERQVMFLKSLVLCEIRCKPVVVEINEHFTEILSNLEYSNPFLIGFGVRYSRQAIVAN